ncbi:MAG TPA: hypothetical protein VMY77_14545 [Chitinophagaceae bacterium]|nr:hypothetical protein [Chitinophagaceae bacterium]
MSNTEENECVYKLAFDVIEEVCRAYSIAFKINYSSSKNANCKSNHWSVTVMSKTFRDKDPIVAIKAGIKLVLDAHNYKIQQLK